MRIHHLNCGCMCPPGGALMDGFSRGPTGLLICHCLLVETEQGLVMIDTGFGMRDVEDPYARLSPLFIHMNRIKFDPERTALGQVRRLGFDPRDVRHIVLTHLDFDHAGGLEDFPEATVHVMEAEADAARRREGFIARRRYRPEQWDEVKRWRFYERDGSRWFGFDAVRDLDGLPPEILMIPLPGHTWGHAGVAVDTGVDWVLDAGDVYFNRHEMSRYGRHCPAGARAYQRLMAVDHDLHLENQERVRDLAANPRYGVNVFCSHDAVEFEALKGVSASRNLRAEALQGSGVGQGDAATGGRIPQTP